MEEQGIQACAKREYSGQKSYKASADWFADYIGNEQETQRNPSINDDGEIIEAVSSNIDDRTMHEV